jgi:hypothetical protein
MLVALPSDVVLLVLKWLDFLFSGQQKVLSAGPGA